MYLPWHLRIHLGKVARGGLDLNREGKEWLADPELEEVTCPDFFLSLSLLTLQSEDIDRFLQVWF